MHKNACKNRKKIACHLCTYICYNIFVRNLYICICCSGSRVMLRVFQFTRCVYNVWLLALHWFFLFFVCLYAASVIIVAFVFDTMLFCCHCLGGTFVCVHILKILFDAVNISQWQANSWDDSNYVWAPMHPAQQKHIIVVVS